MQQLGDGAGPGSDVPVQVKGLSFITSIAAGEDTSVAIRTLLDSTSAWTWGDPAANLPGSAVPAEVPSIGTGIAAVAAGEDYELVLGADGSVWGWGDEAFDTLGTQASRVVTSPVEVIGPDSGIVQLAAGAVHVLALRSDGTMLAWGENGGGELGDGGTGGFSGPAQVLGLSAATQVAAGLEFSLAVYLPPMARSQRAPWEDPMRNHAARRLASVACLVASACVLVLLPGRAASAAQGSSPAAGRTAGLGPLLAWGDNTYGPSDTKDREISPDLCTA